MPATPEHPVHFPVRVSWPVAGLLLLTCVFALVRWNQCTHTTPASNIRFVQLNSLRWEPATGTLTRLGSDPFGRMELPRHLGALSSVSLDCTGAPPTATAFYIYQYPDYLPGEAISERWLAQATIERRSGGFSLHWKLADSKLVRLDLPDDLAEPLHVRRVIWRAPFFVLGSWACMATIAAGLATLIGMVAPWWRSRQPHVAEGVTAALLIAAAVSCVRDVPITFFGSAGHDDALFVSQATSIAGGQWLGPFNELTLSKGPTYSLFLAGVARSPLSLRTAQALLHAIAALALVLALRPVLPRASLRLLLLGVLLFEPSSLSAAAVGRVLRSGIQPALVLLTLAGALGVALPARQNRWGAVVWSLVAGVSGIAFWYSREEGVWLVPSLFLLLLVGLVTAARRSPRERLWQCGWLLAPFALFAAGTVVLRTANARHYGAPITIDVKDGHYPDAYGALLRIRPAAFIPGVPVARETRLRAYQVSPAFSELQHDLEGSLGDGWSQFGWEDVVHPASRKEIRGGWFQWALRQAAARKGHYRDAATADAYWAEVAREINRACDAGQLQAGRTRRGFFPHWDASLWTPFRSSLAVAAGRAIQVSDFALSPLASFGTPEQQARFARVTHETGMTDPPRPTAWTYLRLLSSDTFRLLGLPLCLAAMTATVWLAIRVVRRKSAWWKLAITLCLSGGAAALVTVVALVDVTSFSAVHGIYLAPATPLICAWWVLALAWAFEPANPECVLRPDPSETTPA